MAFERFDAVAIVSSERTVRGRGYNSMRKRFRALFDEQFRGGHNLVNVITKIAFDDKDPRQMEAIKFAMAYGFGQPEKLDHEQVIVLAERMVQRQIEGEKLKAIAAVEVKQ